MYKKTANFKLVIRVLQIGQMKCIVLQQQQNPADIRVRQIVALVVRKIKATTRMHSYSYSSEEIPHARLEGYMVPDSRFDEYKSIRIHSDTL